MRISDWSSDVCSSDLGRQLLELWRKKIILYEDGTPRTKHLVTNHIIEIDPNGRTATAKSYYTVVQTIFTLPPQIIVMGRYDEIGRESCRERVCQYVYISVVAVSLKKKK